MQLTWVLGGVGGAIVVCILRIISVSAMCFSVSILFHDSTCFVLVVNAKNLDS